MNASTKDDALIEQLNKEFNQVNGEFEQVSREMEGVFAAEAA